MRLAILCSADSYRGSAVSFLHIAQGLSARGIPVRLLTCDESVTRPLQQQGADAMQLDLRSTNLRTARHLRAELKAFGADLLIVDRPRDLRLGFLATIWSRVALVYRYNAHAPAPPSDFLMRAAYLLKVRETVFLTEERAARMLPLAPWMRRRPHCVIHEGISMDQFCPDPAAAAEFRARFELGDAPFVFNVGALTPEKRTELLIDAMRHVPNAPLLVLCGEGPLRNTLDARAAERGVRVRFLDRMSRDELRGAYGAASVFAHACPVETFGLSTLEAMACGAPVVGVRGGGLLEIIGNHTDAGLLVEPENAEALAAGITRVLGDARLAEQLRLGGRARAAARFTLAKMAEGYAGLL